MSVIQIETLPIDGGEGHVLYILSDSGRIFRQIVLGSSIQNGGGWVEVPVPRSIDPGQEDWS